jgi:hypothetical protein|tara:strand:- start:1095 stop:1334 length:240 start_codon:yes stop_codon:yes gene_type:complete
MKTKARRVSGSIGEIRREYSIGIARHSDGTANLIVLHRGVKLEFPLTAADRRRLGRMLTQPLGDCPAGGPVAAIEEGQG